MSYSLCFLFWFDYSFSAAKIVKNPIVFNASVIFWDESIEKSFIK